MHRVVVVVATVLLAGCDFTAGADPGTAAGGVDSGGGGVARSCHVQGSEVRLCLDFENTSLTPVVFDGSPGRHDASASNLESMPRASQLAALVAASSQLIVPETPDLDITPNLTIEMWLEPTQFIWDMTWPLSNDTQYGLGLAGDVIACTIGGQTAWAASYIAIDTWSHVACTYDGATITVYVGGDVAGCLPTKVPIPTSGTTGTAIGGGGYIGGIDDIHVYSDALAADALCQLSGSTDCKQACPSGSLGD
jgi:concanavalin A-like lectin/glucanase superfamily protein